MNSNRNELCDRFDREIWLYISREMDNNEENLWRRHLQVCDICQTKLDDIEKTLNACDSLNVDIDDITLEKSLQRVMLTKKRPQYRLYYATAVMILLLLIPVLIFKHPASENKLWNLDQSLANLDSSIADVANDLTGLADEGYTDATVTDQLEYLEQEIAELEMEIETL